MEDGIKISKVLAKIRGIYPVAHNLIFDYYVFGKNFMQLASDYYCSETHVGKKREGAEGLFKGYLLALNLDLKIKQTGIDADKVIDVTDSRLKTVRSYHYTRERQSARRFCHLC